MRRAPLALLTTLAALAAAAPAAHGFTLEPLAPTFSAPVNLSGPPGDPDRVLVVEKAGQIQLVKNGVKSLYLDVDTASDRVDSTGGEEGLLSMAFASPTRFYVFYNAVRASGGTGSDLVVEGYDVAPGGDTAVAGSGDEILRIEHHKGDNHNGGQLQWGPDGNLWISVGDGGGVAQDSDGDAQDPDRLLGKLLRISPRPGGGYDIPEGNPFADGGGRPEVWALGLRNPWRFSFDRATGDLILGDVGEGEFEEINRLPAPGTACGANFGWP